MDKQQQQHILILFSGTKSFSKVFENHNWDCRGVDIDNHFKPYYNVDILTWDYKTDLKDWKIDYLHSSPVCSEFSQLKKGSNQIRNMGLGISLVEKTLEIINYILTINPQLIFTIENPVGLMRTLDIMKPYKRITTSYCKYGYPYRKNTDFWCNFDLKLDKCCIANGYCTFKINNKGIHPVRIGYKPSEKHKEIQKIDWKYFSSLKKTNPEYKGYTSTHMRYRIPTSLIKEIYKQI